MTNDALAYSCALYRNRRWVGALAKNLAHFLIINANYAYAYTAVEFYTVYAYAHSHTAAAYCRGAEAQTGPRHDVLAAHAGGVLGRRAASSLLPKRELMIKKMHSLVSNNIARAILLNL